ncbi:MAG TPA: D-hexose-6-phosphate mutarotase [Gemmataceae bacterium]|nr:D-hexose-6-phosphate mutarotase [Gemmataceae bacterium]
MGHPGAVADLNRRLGIPGVAQVVEGNGGLAKVQVTAADATGEIYLHGAHVTSWAPRAGKEVLFVSSQSQWKAGAAIRGGVPICFPWFANKADDHGAPAHGFVRAKAWQLESIVQDAGAVEVSLSTESGDSTKKWWPFDFRLVYHATFGSELSLELVLTNTGTKALRFEEALHTYLKVGDIEKVRLQGLDTVHYLDKTDSNREKIQDGALVIGSETDRVYLNTQQAVEADDESLHRRVRVAKENSLTTVVWNPWVQKARAMSDLEDAEWKQMVCVETCNVSPFAINVAPGQQHRMRAIIQVTDW